MNKKHFIQSVIIRSLPELSKLDAAVDYAENLWDVLNQRGYGADKSNETPRDNKDWFAQLQGEQLLWFKKFWIAFNYKKGRNGAAKSWYELGKKSVAEYQHIVEAADKEAKQETNGQVRKMAQGWLSEQRYADYEPVQARSESSTKKHLAIGLTHELNAIKRLYESGGDPALLAQIKKLEQAIRHVRT